MHELKLEPVGVGEEHGVIAGAIVRIVGRSVENPRASREERRMQAINVGAALGMPGEMMKPGTVAVVSAIGARGSPEQRRRPFVVGGCKSRSCAAIPSP